MEKTINLKVWESDSNLIFHYLIWFEDLNMTSIIP